MSKYHLQFEIMHPEKCSLTWDTYSHHLKSMMKELMMNGDFSDVTIVTEDRKQLKANIHILSACSPVFKDMLKKEKNSSPIMYLRGIQYSEMESILQYIYLGEATFFEERMNEFLAVAKLLEIKGLCSDENETYVKPDDEPSLSETVTSAEKLEENNVLFDFKTNIDTSADNIASNSADLSDSADKSESADMSDISEKFTIARKNVKTKKRRRVNVNRKHECEQCHKTFHDSSSLRRHRRAVHEGVKYACDQCDYQANLQSNLNVHIQSKHEGVMYPCDQCTYQATKKSHLHRHIQTRHNGVKYSEYIKCKKRIQ